MFKSAKDLVDEAKASTRTVAPAEADGKLILDVREAPELDKDGAIDGAVHIPRGLLEWKADAEADSGNPALTGAMRDGACVHVLCASGGRATMAAATLKRMGYDAAVIEGGLQGWKQAGLPVKGGN